MSIADTVSALLFVIIFLLNDSHQNQTVRECSCTRKELCNFTTAICAPFENGTCKRENVALGKKANISTLYEGTDLNQAACTAVNGNISSEFISQNSNVTNPNCIQTNPASKGTHRWVVDLGRNYVINYITIHPRKNWESYLNQVKIFVDRVSCYTFTKSPEVKDFYLVKCRTSLTGRYVKLEKLPWNNSIGTDKTNSALSLCEVQVWVCRQGFHGQECSKKCNPCVTCDIYNGTCTGGCKPGHYGDSCQYACSNCVKKMCASDGNCIHGCVEGFAGAKCDLNAVCPSCKGGRCRLDKTCIDGCIDGWIGPKCDRKDAVCSTCIGERCYANKTCIDGCKDDWIGPKCKVVPCQKCKKKRCHVDYTCIEGCVFGWIGPKCDLEDPDVCPKCKRKKCRSDQTCYEGCIDGWTGPKCNKKAQELENEILLKNETIIAPSQMETKERNDSSIYPIYIIIGLMFLVLLASTTYLFVARMDRYVPVARGNVEQTAMSKKNKEEPREPVRVESVISESFTTESVIAEPVVAETIIAEPVIAKPVTVKHVIAKPVTAEPVTAKPVIAEPVFAKPVTAEPVIANPVTAEPVTANPVTANPVTAEPVTASPVTTEPVTASPVTAEPVTASPVTAEPVTASPVTTEPVTASPVIAEPVTAEPDPPVQIPKTPLSTT